MFIQISRSVIESFKDAFQLFGDVWAPIAEACINLGGSILFGYLWGLNGVLVGVNLSLLIIILLWKPYYIFHFGMKSSVIPYYFQYILHLLVLLVSAYIATVTMMQIRNEENNILIIVISIIFGIVIFMITSYIVLFIFTKGMRMFTARIKNILTHVI